MTTWAFRTIVVPASLVEAARDVGDCLDGAAKNMYTTPLSPDGKAPASHYISSGLMSAAFMPLLADASMMYQAAQYNGAAQGLTLTATFADCEALVAQSDVSEEPPFDALARLGLMLMHDAS